MAAGKVPQILPFAIARVNVPGIVGSGLLNFTFLGATPPIRIVEVVMNLCQVIVSTNAPALVRSSRHPNTNETGGGSPHPGVPGTHGTASQVNVT